MDAKRPNSLVIRDKIDRVQTYFPLNHLKRFNIYLHVFYIELSIFSDFFNIIPGSRELSGEI